MGFSLAERLPGYNLEKLLDVPPVYSADDALAEFNALSPAQKSRFAAGMVVAASSDEADEQFKNASRTAAAAAATIETLFANMNAQLISLGNAQNFVDTNTAIQRVSMFFFEGDIIPDLSIGVGQEFQAAFIASQRLALRIAQDATGEDFAISPIFQVEPRR